MTAALPRQTGVAIAGGGLVGLKSSLLLQQLQVPFVLLEKSLLGSVLPPSRAIYVRTMEIFCQLGVEDQVKVAAAASWEQGGFGGARKGRTMLKAEPLDFGKSLEQVMVLMTRKDPSTSTFCACPQSSLEPILLQNLKERGGDVHL